MHASSRSSATRIRSEPNYSTVSADRHHIADKLRSNTGVESAAFKDQPDEEVERLMHMVVVGGGPTGVEYAGELHDFLIVSVRTLI